MCVCARARVDCSINCMEKVSLAAEVQGVISNPLSFREKNVVCFLYLCTHDLFVVDVKCTSHLVFTTLQFI